MKNKRLIQKQFDKFEQLKNELAIKRKDFTHALKFIDDTDLKDDRNIYINKKINHSKALLKELISTKIPKQKRFEYYSPTRSEFVKFQNLTYNADSESFAINPVNAPKSASQTRSPSAIRRKFIEESTLNSSK